MNKKPTLPSDSSHLLYQEISSHQPFDLKTRSLDPASAAAMLPTHQQENRPPSRQTQQQNPLEVDFVVNTVCNKIKVVENKYIDLANFYKETAQMQGAKLGSKPTDATTENVMIRELIENKRQLEDQINTLRRSIQPYQLPSSESKRSYSPSRSPQKSWTPKSSDVHSTFTEIFDSIDQLQGQSLHAMSQKQNEMFQLASRFKLQSSFRNEALGLWYDAKSTVAQLIADFKQQAWQRKTGLDDRLKALSPSSKASSKKAATASGDKPRFQNDPNEQMQTELHKFQQTVGKLQRQISKLQQGLIGKEQTIATLQQKTKFQIAELNEALFQHESNCKSLGQPHSFGERVQSPFGALKQYRSGSNSVLNASSGQQRGKSRPTSHQRSDFSRLTSAQNAKQSHTESMQGVRTLFDRFNEDNEKLVTVVTQRRVISEDLLACADQLSQDCIYFCQRNDSLYQHEQEELAELQYNNEQLFEELRRANNHNLELKLEISKLAKKQPKPEPAPDGHSDPSFRLLAKTLCDLVCRFLHDMRQLQKAVNLKDADVSAQKKAFEASKKALSAQVVSIQDELAVAGNHGVSVGASEQRTRSTGPPLPKAGIIRADSGKRTVTQQELQKLPSLLQSVKNLSTEKAKLQELIAELKSNLGLQEADKEVLTQNLRTRSDLLATQSGQLLQQSLKLRMQELLLADYRARGVLHQREEDLEQRLKLQMDQVTAKMDPASQALSMLRDELVCQVKAQERQMTLQTSEALQKLQQREADLTRVKTLFVEKLRQLEVSFVEISQEVDQVEAHHQQQSQQQPSNQLERSVESVLSKMEMDEREKEMEQLVQANEDLMDLNCELKQQVKRNQPDQTASEELVLELQEALDELQQKYEARTVSVKQNEDENQSLKREVSTLKYDNKRQAMDLKDARERFDKVKSEYQAQFNGLKQTIVAMKNQMAKDDQKRIQLESAYLEAKESMVEQLDEAERIQNEKAEEVFSLNLRLDEAQNLLEEAQAAALKAVTQPPELDFELVEQHVQSIFEGGSDSQEDPPPQLAAIVEALRDRFDAMRAQVDSKDAEAEAMKLDLQEAAQETVNLENQIQTLQALNKQEHQRNQTKSSEALSIQKHQLDVLEQELEGALEDKASATSQLDHAHRKLQTLVADNQSLTESLQQAEKKLQEPQNSAQEQSSKLLACLVTHWRKVILRKLEQAKQDLDQQSALHSVQLDGLTLQVETGRQNLAKACSASESAQGELEQELDSAKQSASEMSQELQRHQEQQSALQEKLKQEADSSQQVQEKSDKMSADLVSTQAQLLAALEQVQLAQEKEAAVHSTWQSKLDLAQSQSQDLEMTVAELKFRNSQLQEQLQGDDGNSEESQQLWKQKEREIIRHYQSEGELMGKKVNELRKSLETAWSLVKMQLSEVEMLQQSLSEASNEAEKRKADVKSLLDQQVQGRQKLQKQFEESVGQSKRETTLGLLLQRKVRDLLVRKIEAIKQEHLEALAQVESDLMTEKMNAQEGHAYMLELVHDAEREREAEAERRSREQAQSRILATQAQQAQKASRLMQCLQARMREAFQRKLEQVRAEALENDELSYSLTSEFRGSLTDKHQLGSANAMASAVRAERTTKLALALQQHLQNMLREKLDAERARSADQLVLLQSELQTHQMESHQANAEQVEQAQAVALKMEVAQQSVNDLELKLKAQQGAASDVQRRSQLALSLQSTVRAMLAKKIDLLQFEARKSEEFNLTLTQKITALGAISEAPEPDQATRASRLVDAMQAHVRKLLLSKIESLKLEHEEEVQRLQDADTSVELTPQIMKLEDLESAQVGSTRRLREQRLLSALQSHLRSRLLAKIAVLQDQQENMLQLHENLVSQSQKAEFKQVQIEGELQQARAEHESYKKNAHKMLTVSAERSSELRKEDALKADKIRVLEEALSAQNSQIEDYTTQIDKLSEELEVHEAAAASFKQQAIEAQSQLKLKDRMYEQVLAERESASESPTKSEDQLRKELGDKVELVRQLEADLAKAKTTSHVADGTAGGGRNSWEGRGSWGSGGGSLTANAEVEEHLRHVRDIMTQFLCKLPFTTKDNEDILPIVFSMLNFSEEETAQIKAARDALNAQVLAEQKKKGSFFGNIGKQGKKK